MALNFAQRKQLRSPKKPEGSRFVPTVNCNLGTGYVSVSSEKVTCVAKEEGKNKSIRFVDGECQEKCPDRI